MIFCRTFISLKVASTANAYPIGGLPGIDGRARRRLRRRCTLPTTLRDGGPRRKLWMRASEAPLPAHLIGCLVALLAVLRHPDYWPF
jgi:hypothetical protein